MGLLFLFQWLDLLLMFTSCHDDFILSLARVIKLMIYAHSARTRTPPFSVCVCRNTLEELWQKLNKRTSMRF